MKNFWILTFTLLSMGHSLAADLPQIQKPTELDSGEFAEGTITTLIKDDIKDYLPWANNAKKNLENALSESKRLPIRERMIFLENEVKSVVLASAPKKYQQLMRFALNRGLLLVDVLEKEADSKQIGVIQNQLDVLTRSIKISFDFYESDIAFQKRATEGNSVIVIPQAELGIKLAKEFFKSSEGILDASAQYQVMKKTFEILNWDLSQDQESKNFSEEIIEIYNATLKMPLQVKSDDEAIRHVRSMNYLKLKLVKKMKNEISSTNIQTEKIKDMCGLDGSIKQRIQDCSSQEGSHRGSFILVTRMKNGQEIFKDSETDLLWSDQLKNKTMNTGFYYWEAEASCGEDLSQMGGIKSVKWRLPTIGEFKKADKDGIRSSIPNMENTFWSSTFGFQMNAWTGGKATFYGSANMKNPVIMSLPTNGGWANVRCVGNEI